MKKIIFFLSITVITSSLFAQKSFYTQTLQELIVINTLIAESRFSELSIFLDESGYQAETENFFVKTNIPAEFDNIGIFFSINEKQNINVYIAKNKNGSFASKLPKWEVFELYQKMTSSIELGLPWGTYKMLKESFLDQNHELGQNSEVKIIDRYHFEAKNLKSSEWNSHMASNFWGGLTNDNAFIYTFFGPGKTDGGVQIIFPKMPESTWDDKIYAVIYFEADKCDYQCEDEEQMNVQFFMSLNNFNDRIWDDK